MKLNVMMPKLQMSALRCLVVMGLMSLAYCSFKPKTNLTGDKMTAKEAIVTAVEYFPEKEYGSVADYEIAINEDNALWLVSFTRYKPARVPGGHLIITVPKDKEGKIKIMPGE